MKYLTLALALAAAPVAAQQNPVGMVSFSYDTAAAQIEGLPVSSDYEPYAMYLGWWKETAECAGIPLPPAARIDSVRFIFVNAERFVPLPQSRGERKTVDAITYGAAEQIVVAVRQVKDKAKITHEMLHQLLYWFGEPDFDSHDRPEFKKCSPVHTWQR